MPGKVAAALTLAYSWVYELLVSRKSCPETFSFDSRLALVELQRHPANACR